MPNHPNRPQIPLPKAWNERVKSAVLHVISLAQFAVAYTRGWAANSINSRIRVTAQRDDLQQQVGWLTEQLRLLSARMGRVDPLKRPHYLPVERMAILEIRAACGWSLKETARVFLVTPATIRSWLGRLEDEGPDALVQMSEPVNRFPDYVRYLVQRLTLDG